MSVVPGSIHARMTLVRVSAFLSDWEWPLLQDLWIHETFCISMMQSHFAYPVDTQKTHYWWKLTFRNLLMWKVHKANFNTCEFAITITHVRARARTHTNRHTHTHTHTQEGKGQTKHYHKTVHFSIIQKIYYKITLESTGIHHNQ